MRQSISKTLILSILMNPAFSGFSSAQVENLPSPGQKKTEFVPVHLRIKDTKDKASFDKIHQVPDGWIIVSIEVGRIVDGVFHPHDVGRLGSTGGPEAVRIRDGGHVLSREEVKQGYREVLDSLAKKIAEDGKSDKEKKTRLDELHARISNEYDSYLVRFNEASSSHEAVHITAWTQCQWNNVLGATIYKSGGLIEANVKVELMYVGTRDYMLHRVEQFKREFDRIAK